MKDKQTEMVKAIYSTGEYRLAPAFESYHVPASEWIVKTQQQREKHVQKLLGAKFEQKPRRLITKKLSITHSEAMKMNMHLNSYTVGEIWDCSEVILSNEEIKEVGGRICVSDNGNVYMIKECGKDKYECTCIQYKKIKLCPHIVVACETNGKLEMW